MKRGHAGHHSTASCDEEQQVLQQGCSLGRLDFSKYAESTNHDTVRGWEERRNAFTQTHPSSHFSVIKACHSERSCLTLPSGLPGSCSPDDSPELCIPECSFHPHLEAMGGKTHTVGCVLATQHGPMAFSGPAWKTHPGRKMAKSKRRSQPSWSDEVHCRAWWEQNCKVCYYPELSVGCWGRHLFSLSLRIIYKMRDWRKSSWFKILRLQTSTVKPLNLGFITHHKTKFPGWIWWKQPFISSGLDIYL